MRLALRRDVELLGRGQALAVAVGTEGGDHHDRVLGERDVAVDDVLEHDPAVERDDRLVAHDLLDGLRHELGALAQQRPLVGMLGEQPDPVSELALRRVDAADEHVEHEVDQLVVAQPIALVAGGDERRDEVVAGRPAPVREHLARPRVELLAGSLDAFALGQQARPVELTLDPVGPFVQARGVGQRRAHDRGDRQRRIGLGERVDELAAPRVVDALEQLPQEPAHGLAPAVR